MKFSKSIKFLGTLLLVSCLSVAMVGCGSQKSDDNSSTQTASDNNENKDNAQSSDSSASSDQNNDATASDNTDSSNKKVTVVSTGFPGYDMAKAIGGDDADVTMLLKPGAESHTFEPSPQDIIKIKNADIFIYAGGDSDEWVDDMLSSIDTSHTKVIKMLDTVKKPMVEKLVKGMQDDEDEGNDADKKDDADEGPELDEHVWTSLQNCIDIADVLKNDMSEKCPEYKQAYEANFEKYSSEMKDLIKQFKQVVDNAKRKTIVVGDRFPFAYFCKEFGLKYYAAFPGCSAQTDANPATVAFLVDKVKQDKIPVVFHRELSNDKLAKTICGETGAKMLELNSGHNVTAKQWENGTTYIDMLKQNLKTLKEALN